MLPNAGVEPNPPEPKVDPPILFIPPEPKAPIEPDPKVDDVVLPNILLEEGCALPKLKVDVGAPNVPEPKAGAEG